MRAPPNRSTRPRLRAANWLFLLFALLMVLPACAKKSAATGSMAPGMDMGGMGGGDYADESMEEGYMVDGANMTAESEAYGGEMDDNAGDYEFKRSAKVAREVMAQPAAAPVSSRSEPAPPPPESEPESLETPKAHGRQIVYTAQMRVGVYNVLESMKVVEALPEKYGGWVHQRVEGRVVMKIPAANLKKAMAEASKLGNVEARNLQASDVTAEYTDLQSRIKVLQETQTQLLGLLKKAKTVEEALHVRTALDNVTMQLEVALGRMRQLSNMISFSTLTVELAERGPNTPVPSSNDPFPWVDSLGIEAAEWR